MKKNIYVLASTLVVFAAALVLIAVRPAPTVRAASQPCTNSTLNVTLGLWGPGNKGHNGWDRSAWDLSMLITFDGLGKFSGSHVIGVKDGEPVSGSDGSFTNGTYSVNADCSFTAESSKLDVFGNRKLTLKGIAVRGGNEVVGTWYSPDGQSGTFHAEAVISY
jgi:hypothetical protein